MTDPEGLPRDGNAGSFHTMAHNASSLPCARERSKAKLRFLIPQSLDVGTAIEELLLVWFAPEAWLPE